MKWKIKHTIFSLMLSQLNYSHNWNLNLVNDKATQLNYSHNWNLNLVNDKTTLEFFNFKKWVGNRNGW